MRQKNKDSEAKITITPHYSQLLQLNSFKIKKFIKKEENIYKKPLVNNYKEKVGVSGSNSLPETNFETSQDYRKFIREILCAMGRPATVQEYQRQIDKGIDFVRLYEGKSDPKDWVCWRKVYRQKDDGCKTCRKKCETKY